jgi:sulfite reductase (NADPH) hemoprotein beta-component
VETIVDTYIVHRQSPAEPFLDTYRRTGPAPFKEALYGAA